MAPTIGLLGDVMLGRAVAEALAETPPAEVWAPEVRDLARSCDVVVGNLECCISKRGRPTGLVRGKPFFFRAPPQAVESLRALGVRAVSIANNHALDYGEEALADTLAHLHGAGIKHAGAGRGAEEARAGAIVDAGSARLGLVAVSDHPAQFAAQRDQWGINYADLAAGATDAVLEEVASMRARCDLLLFFPHWGPNMTTAPAAWQRELARKVLDGGADIVAGHSAHVFHGVERTPQGFLLYDLGDALDDYAVDRDLRNDLGVLALWRPGEADEIELVGLRLHYCHTSLATGEDADWIARRLAQACEKLGTTVERVGEQRFRVA